MADLDYAPTAIANTRVKAQTDNRPLPPKATCATHEDAPLGVSRR